VARIDVALQRAWLSWCYDNDTGANFRAALTAQRDARASALSTGSVVSATSANLHSVSFSAPGEVGFSGVDLLRYWQDMLDLFDERKAALGGTPTDAQVYAEMRYVLQPVSVVRNDYSLLRE